MGQAQTMEKVGQVSKEECDEMQKLFNRKNALRELAHVLQEKAKKDGQVDDLMYERLLKDIDENQAKFQEWWKEKSARYQWKSVDGGNWSIDFNTGDIFLTYHQAG